MPLAIDIISDVVCPWCFIGKRRLESALGLYRERNPQAPEPQIAFHPFELNPDIPREGIPRAEYIAKKFSFTLARSSAFLSLSIKSSVSPTRSPLMRSSNGRAGAAFRAR
jgi:predicted DsbA family dithiol-disulfide isomerase